MQSSISFGLINIKANTYEYCKALLEVHTMKVYTDLSLQLTSFSINILIYLIEWFVTLKFRYNHHSVPKRKHYECFTVERRR